MIPAQLARSFQLTLDPVTSRLQGSRPFWSAMQAYPSASAMWLWSLFGSGTLAPAHIQDSQAADDAFAAWIHFQAAMAVGVADHQPRCTHLVADAPGARGALMQKLYFCRIAWSTDPSLEVWRRRPVGSGQHKISWYGKSADTAPSRVYRVDQHVFIQKSEPVALDLEDAAAKASVESTPNAAARSANSP